MHVLGAIDHEKQRKLQELTESLVYAPAWPSCGYSARRDRYWVQQRFGPPDLAKAAWDPVLVCNQSREEVDRGITIRGRMLHAQHNGIDVRLFRKCVERLCLRSSVYLLRYARTHRFH